MKLGEAFKRAVQKYYEGGQFETMNKVDARAAKYSLASLDELKAGIVKPKSSKKEIMEEEDAS